MTGQRRPFITLRALTPITGMRVISCYVWRDSAAVPVVHSSCVVYLVNKCNKVASLCALKTRSGEPL